MSLRLSIAPRVRLIILVGVLSAACNPVRGCAESDFTLADDSRLPRWFVLPSGVDRTDVTVVLTYYMGASGRIARFVMRHRDGTTIADVEGPQQGLEPRTLVPAPQTGPLPYPLYEIVTIDGVTELIEHRQRGDSVFYISDDPQLRRKLGVPE